LGAVTGGWVARGGVGVACRLRWWEPGVVGAAFEPPSSPLVVPEPPDVPPPEGVCVAAPMPMEAPIAPTMPSEARPVWSRLLR
jgi:hypothetical protein